MWIRGSASFQALARLLCTRVCYAIHYLILLYSTFVLPFLVCPAATESPSSVYVTLENGSPLYGSYLQSTTGKPVSQFLGIPFAEPPVGALRFRKPTAKKAWHEPFNATSQSNACVQSMDTYFGDFQGSTMWNSNVPTSEDCLYLNLWVPERVDRSKRLAVLVWVYGGGFWSGSATLDVYDGKVLASEENVIVVAMNYRLSVFGFLYLGREEAPGNMGLWDQWLAMKWIHENIVHFGGDNQRITLFGESAGAASVSMHMLSRHSTPYFHRAILQSGSANAPWAVENRQVALHRAVVLYEYMKCGNMSHSKPSDWNTDELLRCMMETSAEKLRLVVLSSLMKGSVRTGLDVTRIYTFHHHLNPDVAKSSQSRALFHRSSTNNQECHFSVASPSSSSASPSSFRSSWRSG